MNYPKFILTGEGILRLGMVPLHRHLLQPGDVCLGGGIVTKVVDPGSADSDKQINY